MALVVISTVAAVDALADIGALHAMAEAGTLARLAAFLAGTRNQLQELVRSRK